LFVAGINRTAVNPSYLTAGTLVLVLGIGYYQLCRSHPPADLAPFSLHHQCRTGWLGIDWLGGIPTFVHTLAFTLLCSGLTSTGLQSRWALVWTGTNIMAELWSSVASSYGTYDRIDLLWALLGGIVAVLPQWWRKQRCGSI
jgi:hypothetical protein